MIQLDKLLELWNKYSQREQLIIAAGACLLILLIIYQLIYLPIYSSRQSKLQEISDKESTLIFIKQVVPFLKNDKAKFIRPTELMGVIQTDLNKDKFKSFPSDINQVNKSDVEIKFQQVPYNTFIKWLWDLNQKYQFVIKALDVQAACTEGICSLHIVLGGEI